MVGLVLRGDAAKDRDRVFNARFAHEDLLEAPLEGGVLLNVLPVLVEGRCADHAELSSGEHRLEHVPRIHRSLGAGARADDRVEFVNKGDDLPVRALDLSEDRLEALFEFAPVLRAGNHCGQVEGDEDLVPEGFRDVACDDALREAFHNCGLADAGLANENRVVLRAAAQDLDDSADLRITADHGVELALARHLRQVAAVLLEGLEGPLGVGGGDRFGAKTCEGFAERLRGCACA